MSEKKKKVVLELPEDVARIIQKYPFVRDFIVDRITKDIKRRIDVLKKADELLKNSELTEEEILRLDKLIKAGIMEKFR